MRSIAAQIQLYFPEKDHPAYGIVRSVVRDSTDVYTGSESVSFLDSDGQVYTPFKPS